MDILNLVTRVPLLVFGVDRHDDDFADRINYKYTTAILVIFAIIVTNRQFGTKQIHCWIPAYFTRNYEEYINDICWVSNTYYISLDQKLPEADQIRKSFELKYYQWVPFILLSQAVFFYIPHIAWRALSRRSGIDVRDIVEAAGNYKSVDKYENRQKYMSYMLTAVDQYVDDPRRRKESRTTIMMRRVISAVCCVSGKFLGNYLMVLYLFIKLVFIANCISQLFLLNLLLGHEFHKFGFELLEKIINGKGWDTGSRIFPKISMCDFRIREVGNPKVSHRYTVQCVLPINLFNQQIFIFIWFWYSLVLIINLYSLCVWSYRFLPSNRLRYIKRRIEIMRQALFWRHKNALNFEQMPDESIEMHEFEKEIIHHFVHDYLESDGLFILRVLSSNTSDFVCTELIQELWKYYRKQRKFNRSSGDEINDDDEDDDDDEDLNDDDDDDDLEEFKPEQNIASKKIKKKNNFQIDKSKTDSNIEENDENNCDYNENENDNSDINDSDSRSKMSQQVSKNQLNYHKKNNRIKDQYYNANSQNYSAKNNIKNKNQPISSGQLDKKSKNQFQYDEKISSSNVSNTLKRVLSHEQKTITSPNLVNSQFLTRKLNKKNNIIDKSSNTTNLDETVNSDLAETEIDFNENNKRNNNKNFVRLNSNSIDPAKNKYLETET